MQGLGPFLKSGFYCIPDYQREYSWDDENQVCDFWEDLITLANERAVTKADEEMPTHFFGQVVIHNDKGILNLIDGQQRITTSVIALSVFRDVYEALKSSIPDADEEYSDIKSLYIGRYKESTGTDKLRFRLGENDRKYFRNNIQIKSPSEKPVGPAQTRIKAAYDYLKKRFDEYLSTCKTDNDRYLKLNNLFDSFSEGFRLLSLMTDDISEAFVIFETLNARGKDLETADLLKNYFFMKSNGSVKNIEQIKEHWNDMVSTLNKREDTTKLIRYYWNSTRKYVHDKQLYKEISKNVEDYADCFRIVKDLEIVADLYNTLSNPKENHYFADGRISETLKNLQALKVSTFYPVIISLVLKHSSDEDVFRVLKALEIMSFREFAIAGKNPNRIEKFLAALALELTKEQKTIDQAIEAIKENTTGDEEIIVLISKLKPSVNLAKFILRQIENNITDTAEKKLDDSNTAIHLEHIMPQANTIWEYPADEHDELVGLLGNMTLLAEKLNKSVSNSLFEDKKKKYQLSAIKITRDLCDYDTWDKSAIEKRTEFFTEKILKIWPKQ